MSALGPVGIDFGTTKTALAYYDLEGRRQVLSFPTLLYLKNSQKPSWEEAEIGNTENFIQAWRNFKLFLSDSGEEWNKVPIHCHPERLPKDVIPPPVALLTAYVLRKIKLKYCDAVGVQESWDVGPATITVPAFSNFRYRQRLVYAAMLAGFTNISLMEEPVAAYLFHYTKEENSKEIINSSYTVVIDFGGGTCDLALIKNSAGSVPDVLGTYTIKHNKDDLGGNNIDQALITVWKRNSKLHSKLPATGRIYWRLSDQLNQKAQDAKQKHNPKPDGSIFNSENLLLNPLASEMTVSETMEPIPAGAEHEGELIVYPEIKPGDFASVLAEVDFDRNLSIGIDHLLNEAGLSRNLIEQVIIAGGSGYIRRVLQAIRESFPDLMSKLGAFLFEEPEYSIAYGALEYQRRHKWFRPLIQNRLSMSIYMELGFDPEKKISKSKLKATLGNSKPIHYNDKHYLEIARRGEVLEQISGWKYIPIPSNSRKPHYFIIHQVKPSIKKNGEITDYENIDEHSFVEKIEIPANVHLVTLRYRMDRLGNFYRNIKKTISVNTPKMFQDFEDEWTWKGKSVLKKHRSNVFG